jgi:CubicO group peptidase (beta-lactamase class C family)
LKKFNILLVAIFFSVATYTSSALAKATVKAEEQVLLPSLIAAFNQGDRQTASKYLLANINPEQIGLYGIEAHIGGMLNNRNTHGKLTLIKHLPINGNNERAQVIAEHNQFPYILHVNRTATAPYKINYFYLAEPEKKVLSKGKIDLVAFKANLTAFLTKLAGNEAFSGTVLIAKEQNTLFQQAYGQANKSFNVSNNLTTKFSLGSMNKMFTAIATLQLIEQGKLSFEDKLLDYVDSSWLPKEQVEQITIRQLLTHTSGLGNFFNAEFNNSSKGNFRSLSGYKNIIANTPLQFTPGTSNRYSSSGMHMLGLVIEKVSGESYYDYVQKNIYQKAAMVNSASYDLDGITPNLAVGYLKMAHSDTWVNNYYSSGIKGGPAGGGYSTVGDLYHFSQALSQFKLLGKEMTEQIYSNKVQFNSPAWYSYGFVVSGTENNRVIGHNGASLGIDARLDIHLDKDIVVVILANQSDVVAPVRRKINELISQL